MSDGDAPHAAPEHWERSARYVEQPLLSALVFVYGAERFMRGLLDDLLAQTIAPRMEIVVVDTGSPTDEGRIVREYLARHPSIAYLRTDTRESTTAACNRCIRAARGKYLTLACADDRHRPDGLERLVATLEADPGAILAYGDVAVTDTENETLDAAHVVGHFRWPDFDARRLFQVCHVGPQPVYRRELHERHGLYDPAYVTAGDYELWLRVVARGERFVHVPEVLGLYLRSAGSNEHANQALSLAESEKARVVHWPDAWGLRPPAAGNFFVPVPPAPPVARAPLAARADATSRVSEGAPLVSVVMPTFDRPGFLERAVRSVLAQTHADLELIVVNDGGASVDALLASLDDRGRIVSVRLPRNRDRSAARNVALRIARGKYVAYLDDDDWYLPDHLRLLVGALEHSGDAVAYGFAARVTETRSGDGWAQGPPEAVYQRPFHGDALLVGNFIPLPCVVHRRDCLDETGPFDETLSTHEDWDLLIRLAERHAFRQVEQVTCCFSWRLDGSSTTSRERHDFSRTLALIHDRYAHLAAHSPEVRAAQERERAHHGRGAEPPTCSIVIPLFDRVELTRQCLTELARVTNDVRYEVVLVDNGSTDGTPELLAQLSGDVRIVRNAQNLGFAKACNQGAAVARGRYLVFLNNDTIPLPGWLSALTSAAEGRPDVGIVGSKLLYPDGTIQHAGVVFNHATQAYHLYTGLPGDFPAANRRRELQAVTAACMLVRREVFEGLSGFDEGFRNSFEDVDLCLRAGEAGWRVLYEPRSTLFHLESQSAGRHAHEEENGRRLRARWASRSLADEAGVLLADGFVVRTTESGGRRTLVRVAGPDDERRWAHVAHAEQRAAAGDHAGLAVLLAAPDAWPDDAGVLRWAARLCATAEVPRHAPALWRRVLEVEDDADARAALAADALERGDLDAAARLLAPLAADTQHAGALMARGVLELQRGAPAAARDAFAAAERHGAEPRKARIGAGMAALAAGDPAGAWDAFGALLRADAGDAEAAHWLLRAGCALERWPELVPHLESALDARPEDDALRFALAGVLLRAGDRARARERYRELRRAAPGFHGLAELAAALDESDAATPSVKNEDALSAI